MPITLLKHNLFSFQHCPVCPIFKDTNSLCLCKPSYVTDIYFISKEDRWLATEDTLEVFNWHVFLCPSKQDSEISCKYDGDFFAHLQFTWDCPSWGHDQNTVRKMQSLCQVLWLAFIMIHPLLYWLTRHWFTLCVSIKLTLGPVVLSWSGKEVTCRKLYLPSWEIKQLKWLIKRKKKIQT